MSVPMTKEAGGAVDQAATVADLTFRMLADCHEKERRLALHPLALVTNRSARSAMKETHPIGL